jgi:hypothetical protein
VWLQEGQDSSGAEEAVWALLALVPDDPCFASVGTGIRLRCESQLIGDG